MAWLALWAGAFASVQAQPLPPRIGYVYPAGGQQGSTFQVTVGGQNLDGASNAWFAGPGIQAAVIDFHKPMPQGQFNTLRDQLKELQQRKTAALKDGRRRGAGAASTNTWTAADEKKMTEIREKILKNPPNRNATPAIAETVTLKVTLDPEAELGEREIRLQCPNGLSNPMAFHVGQLPEFSKPAAKAPNPDADRFRQRVGKAAASAPARPEVAVTLPTVINGQILPGAADRFRFTARQGQRLVVAANARALVPYLADAVPGWFQATLALLDSKGRELDYADDYRFNPDPVLFCEIPRDGEYAIEIKDAIYRGREDFVYRIALGELPFLTSVFPLGGPADTPTAVELRGWNLPQTSLTLPAQAAGLCWVQTRKDGRVSNRVPFAVDTLPECREQEPNSLLSAPQALTLPAIVNGRIDSPGDSDVFRFEARAGDRIVAETMARRLNSPLDSVLRLTDAQGNLIAFNDDSQDKGAGLSTHHADSLLSATLPASGFYCVHLGDAQRKGGADYGYRLRLSAPRPDFELRVVPSSLSARGGANIPLTVYALRRDGFSNEIALVFKDAPAGFSLSGARVPANQDQARLTLSVPASPLAEPVNLTLEGRATIEGRSVSRPATPAEDMMQAFAYRHLVPAQELKVAVQGRGLGRAAFRVLTAAPVRIPDGGTARVRVSAPVRALGDSIQFELSEPPEGISIKNVEPVQGGAEVVLQCDPAKAKPGLQGNLIVNVFNGRAPAAAKAAAPKRGRAPLGCLPAIPFEVTAR